MTNITVGLIMGAAAVGLSSSTGVALGDAVRVGIFICGSVVWLNWKFAKLERRIDKVVDSVLVLPCHPKRGCPEKEEE